MMSALPQGSVIYKPGDECTGLNVILSGRVKLSLPLSASKERVIALLGPRTWFGETALLLGEPHGVLAETVQPTVLAHIPAQTVLLAVESGLVVRVNNVVSGVNYFFR